MSNKFDFIEIKKAKFCNTCEHEKRCRLLNWMKIENTKAGANFDFQEFGCTEHEKKVEYKVQ